MVSVIHSGLLNYAFLMTGGLHIPCVSDNDVLFVFTLVDHFSSLSSGLTNKKATGFSGVPWLMGLIV